MAAKIREASVSTAQSQDGGLDEGEPWQQLGLCRHVDPEIFFVEAERGHFRSTIVTEAKAVCARCPVLKPCRDHGLNAQEPHGIWGGLTPHERQPHLQAQQRDAPQGQ